MNSEQIWFFRCACQCAASGTDFVRGDVDYGAMGEGDNEHTGAAQSTTTGTLNSGIIKWPASSAETHVCQTELGDIYLSYDGRFLLDTATGDITGKANFHVVGGTGVFEKASGLVLVNVAVTGLNPSGGVTFHYEFDGLVSLKK